ncbi:unnamed protein product [Somion occarium]|uniref:F-box domain-containing protein n=1 Tax=Somion occarium TaxID=3059160 RepID=A0ABP1DLM6_9APHY
MTSALENKTRRSSSVNPESNAIIGPQKRPAEDPVEEEEPSKYPRLADADFSDDAKPDGRSDGSSSISLRTLNPLKRPADDSEHGPPTSRGTDSWKIKRPRLESEADSAVEQQKPSCRSSSAEEAPRKRQLVNDSSPDPGDGHQPAKRIRLRGAKRSKKHRKQRDDALLLPVELHHEILEWLWEDDSFGDDRYYLVRTLHACAQTCSRWRSAARPLIFRFLIIKHPNRLNDLVTLIQKDPQIAGWIQKVRLDGTSIPNDDHERTRIGTVEEDRDCWIYEFLAKIGVPLPSLARLELTGFAHLSKKREDQEAFAHWIRELVELRSVAELNMLRCEMSSNSLAAIVRAFPKLVRIGFASVDFSAPNFTTLRDESSSHIPSNEREASGNIDTLDSSGSPAINNASVLPTFDDGVSTPPSSHDDRTVPVQYPLFHTPPLLSSFAVNNGNPLVYYADFDFLLLHEWLRPEILSKSLKTLDIRSDVNSPSLANFIATLGTSPALECMTLFVGNGLQYFIDSTVDVRSLSNLISIRLEVDIDVAREHIEAMHYVLSQLNAPRLQVITLSIPYVDGFEVLEGTDEYLAKGFDSIKELCVETFTGTPGEQQKARKEIIAMFPLMAERGILRVENWGLPYLF